MYEAVHIASTGLRNQQRRIDSIADNIANVNTVGYKAERLDFKEAIYTRGIDPGPAYTPAGNQQKGHGVMITAVSKDFTTQGSLYTTGEGLDFAIEGKGFFEVEDPYGRVLYTRAGNFYSSDSGDGTRSLVNANGYFVRDIDGNRIEIPEGTNNIAINADGVMTFTGSGEETQVTLGIYTFRNETGLIHVGNNNFIESEVSGEKLRDGIGRVEQGLLEGANVSLATEFTRLIRAQRSFQLAARALTTADQMEGIANVMRK